jgi:hypothetical protein
MVEEEEDIAEIKKYCTLHASEHIPLAFKKIGRKLLVLPIPCMDEEFGRNIPSTKTNSG